jgi:uncharacterized membrane protein
MAADAGDRATAWALRQADAFLNGLGAYMRRLADHWLAAFTVVLGLFVALPLAAPVLAAAGHDQPARWIYTAYRLACHQLPHRSVFLFGPHLTYEWASLRDALDIEAATPYSLLHTPLTDPSVGYQIALCQRDLGIWWALLAATVAYAVARRQTRPAPLSLRAYAVAVVPAAVDGLSQLTGLRESTPWLRVATGALFGAATAWMALPRLDEGFDEVRGILEPRRVSAGGGTSEGPPRLVE